VSELSGRDLDERLRLFTRKVDEAWSLRSAREGTVTSEFTFNFNPTEGSSAHFNVGDNDDLRSLLMAFRPFMSDREDVFVNSVFNDLDNLLRGKPEHADLLDAERHARAEWKLALRGDVNLMVNGKSYQAEDCFDMLVNGDLFHSDPIKIAEREKLTPMIQGLAKTNMTNMVLTCFYVLRAIQEIVDAVLAAGLTTPEAEVPT
jgi:hypothetical protein